MPEVCLVCGREYARNVTDFHLDNDHSITRNDYELLLSGNAELVVEEVEKSPEELEAETPSQTPSPEPEDPKPEPEVVPEPEEEPEPEVDTEVLYQLSQWNRKRYFLDPVSKFRLNKRGKPGDKKSLPKEVTPAIKRAIEQKLIVPVEE